MADTVAVRTLVDDRYQVGVLLTNVSDGTGESAVAKLTLAGVVKADAGADQTPQFIVPTALDLMKAEWTVTGFTKVQLAWHATTPDVIFTTGATYGRFDLTGRGVLVGDTIRTNYEKDPQSTGHTGTVELTTNATPAAGSTYSIVLFFRKRTV